MFYRQWRAKWRVKFWKLVERNVALLRKEGLLQRVGPSKGGKWEVLK
jgi:predicted HTH transcriptional regulator